MQLDSCPLRAADITPDLQKKFAFLSGQIAMSFFCLPFCFVCLLHRIWVICHFVCYFSMIGTPLKFFIIQLNRTALICHSNFPSVGFLFTVYHVTAHASLILLPGIFGLKDISSYSKSYSDKNPVQETTLWLWQNWENILQTKI